MKKSTSQPAAHSRPPSTWYVPVGLFIVGSLFSAYLWQWQNNYYVKTAIQNVPIVSDPPVAASPKPTTNSAANTTEPVIPKEIPHDYTIPPITDGAAPVLTHLPTSEPVVFLGIDDGGTREPYQAKMVSDNHIVASLFLSDRFIHNDHDFFRAFTASGSLIENHSVNHRLLSGLSFEEQKAEICEQADTFAEVYGRRPVLFRPPGGDYDYTTQLAAAACGMKAVVNWIAKANGGSMQYQIGYKLRPGDIVLMHFRPEFKADMQAFIDAMNAAGLHTELLENWLPKDNANTTPLSTSTTPVTTYE